MTQITPEVLKDLAARGATPEELETLAGASSMAAPGAATEQMAAPEQTAKPPPDPSQWTPADLKSVLQRMEAQGATEDEITTVIAASPFGGGAGAQAKDNTHNLTISEKIGGFLHDKFGPVAAQKIAGSDGLGHDSVGIIDVIPGPGNFTAMSDARKNFKDGEYISGVLNTVAAALPPARGPLAGTARHAMQRPSQNPLRNIAPPTAPNAHHSPLRQAADHVNAATPGAPVEIPRIIDQTADAGMVERALKATGARISGTPVIGTPTHTAVGRARGNLEAKIANQVQNSGPVMPREQAGELVKDSAQDYITNRGKAQASAAYDRIDPLLNPNYRGEMTDLARTLDDLGAEQAAARSNAFDPVINSMDEAARATDMTIEGARFQQKQAGKLGKPQIGVADTQAQAAYKRAAGAAARDVDRMINEAGGAAATAAKNSADRRFQVVARNRDAIYKFVGKDVRDQSAISGEKVVGRVIAAARDSTSGNVRALARLRANVDGDAWQAIQRAAHETMGAGSDGGFDALRWAKQINKLSPNGRAQLFGAENGRTAGELGELMQNYVTASGTLGNPSRSGELGVVATMASAMMHGLVTANPAAIGTVAGGMTAGNVFSRILANPKATRSARNVMRTAVRSLNDEIPPAVAAKAMEVAARQLAKESSSSPEEEDEVLSAFKLKAKPVEGK